MINATFETYLCASGKKVLTSLYHVLELCQQLLWRDFHSGCASIIASCPPDSILNGGFTQLENGNYYRVFNDSRRWLSAQADCSTYGAQLAIGKTSQDLDIIFDFFCKQENIFKLFISMFFTRNKNTEMSLSHERIHILF